MKMLLRTSLKARLAILILLAFAPAFALAIFNSLEQLHLQEKAAQENVLRLVRVMRITHAQMVGDAKEFLQAISQLTAMRQKNVERCNVLMNNLVENFPGYTNFGLAKPNGDIFCSTEPAKLEGNIAALSFFKEAVTTHWLGIGPYEIDRSTQKPTVFLGMPIFNTDKKMEAIIFAALDFSHFDNLPVAAQLPSDATIVVFDQAGLILARYPDLQGLSGTYQPQAPLLKHLNLATDEGVTEVTSVDSVQRLYGYAKIHKTPDQDVFLAVGMSSEAAYGAAAQAFQTDVLSLVAVSLLVLAIAWIGSHRLVVRKMRSLVWATDRIRSGDLNARSGLRGSSDEVGQLAFAIDTMADAIQSRVAALQRHGNEMRELKEMNDGLQSCMTRDEVIAIVRQYAQKLFPQQPGALYLLHPKGDYLESKVSWGSPATTKDFLPQDCWAIRRARIYRVEASSDQPRCHHVHEPPPGNYVCVPLLIQGEMLGILHLENDQMQPCLEGEIDSRPLAEAMAEHISLTLGNLKLRDTLHAQAMRDGLTGIFNRRYMEETLVRETRNAERNKSIISIIMLDIDHFKRFNDTFGHAAGDALLRELGKMLQTQMRGGDLACRYGGEEFTIILPGTSLQHAAEIAEKLREGTRDLRVKVDDKAVDGVTISLGAACYPQHGASWQEVLHAADIALLQAKQGRNRVVVYETYQIHELSNRNKGENRR